MRILFVCLGNICRSPTAEGVMRSLVQRAGLADRVILDSAGTGSWHVGERPDDRAAHAAADRGITLSGAARQVTPADLESFDLVLVMDEANRRELLLLAGNEPQRARVRLLREFDPASREAGDLDVPDPYGGGAEGFETVLDLVTTACEGLLREIVAAEAA